jgi:dTDP-4-dehydrorhamnose reductase
MRLLIVGGTGQVGREMADLAPAGVELALPPRSALDLTDRAKVAAAVGAGGWSAVINLAAWTAVDRAETAVADAFAANALGPAILAEETSKAGIPLVHVSTDYVFDGTKAGPYVEDDPVHPLGVYGASKLAGEVAVRTGNPRHLVVRTAWVFGRHGANFVKTMLRLAAERPVVRVVDDQRGTPTAAKDLAEALLTMTARLLADGAGLAGTYHFANAGETTWRGFAAEIFRLSAAQGGKQPELVPIATAEYPTPARRPANSRLSTAKLTQTFGIAPRRGEEALAEVVEALQGRG